MGQKPQTACFYKAMAVLHQLDTWAKSFPRESIITPIFLRNNRNKFLVSDFSSPGFSGDQPRPVRTQGRWLMLMVHQAMLCESPGAVQSNLLRQ